MYVDYTVEMKQSKSGFTIVELIVVIVVIAILATIGIISYRGMQERAVAAAYMVAADQWEKLLRLEYAQTGTIPSTNLQTYCLGRSLNDFPAVSGYSTGECTAGIDTATNTTATTSFSESYISQFATRNDFPSGLVRDTSSRLPGFQGRTRGISILSHTDDGETIVYLIWAPPRNGMCGKGNEWNEIAPQQDPIANTGSCGLLLSF